jgi:hypothetical protein
MKALGLSFSLFVFAALAAPPAEAGFRAAFRPSVRIGPSHDRASPGENRERRRDRWDGAPGFVPTSAAPDAAPAAPPQFLPVPVPDPYDERPYTPSHPRLILIGQQARPHGALPTVVYGDPLPEQAGRP